MNENFENYILDVIDDEELHAEPAQPEESQRFVIDDDKKADWAIRKIKESQAEYARLEEIAKSQIEEIKASLEKAKRKADQSTNYLSALLSNYFDSVPHRKTKTQEKYQLLSGALVRKKGQIQYNVNNDQFMAWLNQSDELRERYIKVTKSPRWGDFKNDYKNTLCEQNGHLYSTETGEVIPGVTTTMAPDTFVVELKSVTDFKK